MKYVGTIFYYDVETWHTCVVTDAIVTPDRIAIEWKQNGVGGFLLAESLDGENYQGHYGYPRLEPEHAAERAAAFKLHRAGTAVLLYGTWQEKTYKDVWVIHLTPNC